MTAVMDVRQAVAPRTGDLLGRHCVLWCPGCDLTHRFVVNNPDGTEPRGALWRWDGELERPTFEPALFSRATVHRCPPEHQHAELCEDAACGRSDHVVLTADPRTFGHRRPHAREFGDCHALVRDGRWEFLEGTDHHLAGQTVDLVPLPGWMTR